MTDYVKCPNGNLYYKASSLKVVTSPFELVLTVADDHGSLSVGYNEMHKAPKIIDRQAKRSLPLQL
jgi:hypothetical protein